MQHPSILVTGAAGYIGSHVCLALLEAGYAVLAVDNLDNGSLIAIERIRRLAAGELRFVQLDVRDRAALEALLTRYPVAATIHLAGRKAVGESVADPLRYFDHNVAGSLALLQALDALALRHLVFSSSATVYGDPLSVPIAEDAPLSVTNPYGRTKLMVEQMLADLGASGGGWQVGVLRYFNPAGAHASGLIGEDPRGQPNNLVPCLAQVACGRRARLSIFGGDYPTPDGTGVRDYLHVMDLARGHVAALARLFSGKASFTLNLGTGRGYSVLEILHAFEAASGRQIPYEIVARRPGDIAQCYADPAQARTLLGWRAQASLEAMCADHWRWQLSNPHGYRDDAWVNLQD